MIDSCGVHKINHEKILYFHLGIDRGNKSERLCFSDTLFLQLLDILYIVDFNKCFCYKNPYGFRLIHVILAEVLKVLYTIYIHSMLLMSEVSKMVFVAVYRVMLLML